jgi:hypothetical protein
MRRPLIALAVLLVPLVTAGAARAQETSGARCEGRLIEQPFTAWDDTADYFLAPDGDFSGGGAGWTFDGAEIAAENEPWYVHGADVDASASLPSGAAVTSPTICVAEDDPTMRFFARGSGDLQVEILYTDGEGVEQALPIGVVAGDSGWAPSDSLPLTVNTYEMTIAFRFTALSGDWVIDDVYVDPYRKGRASDQ